MIEAALTQAVERGLRHLTLSPSNGRWQAAVRNADSGGYRVEIRDDPAEAVLAVLWVDAPSLAAPDDVFE